MILRSRTHSDCVRVVRLDVVKQQLVERVARYPGAGSLGIRFAAFSCQRQPLLHTAVRVEYLDVGLIGREACTGSRVVIIGSKLRLHRYQSCAMTMSVPAGKQCMPSFG